MASYEDGDYDEEKVVMRNPGLIGMVPSCFAMGMGIPCPLGP